MKILHYSLGLPPYRSGGLTKYSYDLMREEVDMGNEVHILYPGYFNISKKTKIIWNKDNSNIKVYEIVNPLPVSLLGGIGIPKKFHENCDEKVYFNFLKHINPEIIHIHTFMGLHKEFLKAAQKLRIKTVYTSHDYFGFCPKVNFIDYKGELCENSNGGQKCAVCNLNSYSEKLLFIMQSKSYRILKESKFIKFLRRYKKNKLNNVENQSDFNVEMVEGNVKEYLTLRNYYIDMFKMIDFFHFNSSVAEKEYKKFLNLKGKVISITHKDVNDYRILKNFDESIPLRITYLGPVSIYKGFYLLKESLDKLIEEGITNWNLNVFGDNNNLNISNEKFIKFNGRYKYDDLKSIFENTDLLIIPSIWKETFGYIGLEAYSHGVPTIVTENVGFKDVIINNVTGIIIKSKKEELYNKIKEIIYNRKILKEINTNIKKEEFKYTMRNHTRNILKLYKCTNKNEN